MADISITHPSAVKVDARSAHANATSFNHPPICNFTTRELHYSQYCTTHSEKPRQYYYTTSKVPRYFNILVDEKHKLLFCSIPKAGCTSWKNHLLKMSDRGRGKGGGIGMGVHNRDKLRGYGLRFLHEYPAARVRAMIADYHKFVVVRHPFARLHSAYKDKFVNYGYSRGLVKRIFAAVRKNSTAGVAEPIGSVRGHNRIYPTFTELAEFIVASQSDFQEAHWARYQDLCAPCEIHYTHVLKLETMDADFRRFIKLPFMASDTESGALVLENPSSKGAAPPSSSLEAAFRELPAGLHRQLYERYKPDMDMFGYTWDMTSYRQGCETGEDKCC